MNTMTSDYTVVSEHDLQNLIEVVRKKLKEGYEPLDGVQVVAPALNGEQVAPLFLQTLIKR
jgi:hypothetical protein